MFKCSSTKIRKAIQKASGVWDIDMDGTVTWGIWGGEGAADLAKQLMLQVFQHKFLVN